jgi:hypothetical protein
MTAKGPDPENDDVPQGDRAVGTRMRRAVSVATVVIPTLIVVILLWTTRGVLDADEVVQRAALAARTHPITQTDPVSLSFTPSSASAGQPFSIVQGTGVALSGAPGSPGTSGASGASGASAASGANKNVVPPALARMLAAYRFAWEQPLSVERFAAWRTAHACCKQDWMERRTRDGLLVLRTTVPDGELREIELTMEAETYRVVRETFVFQGVGRLEIEDLAHATALRHAAPSYAAPRTSPVVPVAPRGNRDDLNRTALRVRLVPRQSAGGLDHWVNRTFGDHATRASFVPDLTHAIGAVRQRLTVLAALAPRDPDARGELSPAPAKHGRATTAFQQTIDQHYGKLRAELNELRKRISVLAGTPNALVLASQTPPPDLPSRASVGLTHATALEQQVQVLLTHKDLTAAEQDQVRATFGALWQAVHGPAPARQ